MSLSTKNNNRDVCFTTREPDKNTAVIQRERVMFQCGILHVSTVINIVLLISLISLLACLSSLAGLSGHSSDEKDWPRSACIPCEEGEVLVDYRITTTQGRRMCCYNNSEILDLMYSVMANEVIYQEDKNGKSASHSIVTSLGRRPRVPKWWRNRASAAHLFLNTSAINGIKLPWMYSRDESASVLSDDISLINGALKYRPGDFIFCILSLQ